MKDYLLSEIVSRCRKCYTLSRPCDFCETQDDGLRNFCAAEFQSIPRDWEELYGKIEPRDDLVLPAKVYRPRSHDWQVVYRDPESGGIALKNFARQVAADRFLAERKGETR